MSDFLAVCVCGGGGGGLCQTISGNSKQVREYLGGGNTSGTNTGEDRSDTGYLEGEDMLDII